MTATAPAVDTPHRDATADTARRILVIIGHPIPGSLNHALARAYADAADAHGAAVRVHDLAEARIPATDSREQLRVRDGATEHLPPLVRGYINDVTWAQHIVVFFPQWWGTYPAVLKDYLDRVVLSGVAFRYRTGQLPHRLLTGRTARIVMTADGPAWWNRMRYRNAAETSLARATFGYCGVRVAGVTRFMKVRFSTLPQREGWLLRAAALGARDSRTRAGAGRRSRRTRTRTHER